MLAEQPSPSLTARWANIDQKIGTAARPATSCQRRIGANIDIHRVRGTTATSLIGRNISLAIIVCRLRRAALKSLVSEGNLRKIGGETHASITFTVMQLPTPPTEAPPYPPALQTWKHSPQVVVGHAGPVYPEMGF
jgi:hypothetical protein